MALFGDYRNTGAGIAKDAPQKKPFFRYWELVWNKFWKLLEVNMLLMAVFVPLLIAFSAIVLLAESYTNLSLVIAGVMLLIFVLCFGPVIAGCTQILRNFSREKPCFMMSTFFKTFKSSFKQSCPLGIIDILVAVSLGSGFYVYPAMINSLKEAGEGGEGILYALFIATISIAIMVLLMSFYAYLMIVSTDLPFKKILKNSLALSLVELKKNAITFVIAAMVLGLFGTLTYWFPYITVLWVFIPVSFVAFMIVFNCYPVIQKYVINPYYAQRGEINPELVYTQTEGENVFEDKGGKETPAPIEPKKKGKKGKIVS